MVIDIIEIDVVALNYERASKVLRSALREIEAMVHGKDEFAVGDPQFVMGWYFFTLSVSRELIVKVMNLLGNEFLNVKGKSFEKKFVNWLTARLEQFGSNVQLKLKADMETSKYGLF